MQNYGRQQEYTASLFPPKAVSTDSYGTVLTRRGKQQCRVVVFLKTPQKERGRILASQTFEFGLGGPGVRRRRVLGDRDNAVGSFRQGRGG